MKVFRQGDMNITAITTSIYSNTHFDTCENTFHNLTQSLL